MKTLKEFKERVEQLEKDNVLLCNENLSLKSRLIRADERIDKYLKRINSDYKLLIISVLLVVFMALIEVIG